MKKVIQSRKGRRKLGCLIVSALILALLVIPAATSASSLQFFPFNAVFNPAQICTNQFGILGLELALVSNDNFDPLHFIEQNIDLAYMIAGVGVAVLLAFIYTRLIRSNDEFLTNLRKTLSAYKIRKTTADTEATQEKPVQKKLVREKPTQEKLVRENVVELEAVPERVVPDKVVPEVAVPIKIVQREAFQAELNDRILRLYIAVPVLFIVLAELLLFFGKIEVAVYVHLGVLIALSLSWLVIKDLRVHNIHMPLMLLPVLRLINLSIPIFSKITLYSFVLYYTLLAIPVVAIILHQRDSFENIGITKKHFLLYLVLAVPLSFLLGLGEYLIIHPGYLVPDLSLENLLILIIVMVFFVGLVEELIFRSIIQSRLEKVLTLPEALIITSLLFGLMHSGYGTYYEMLYTGFVGLVIGLIFYKTRSLPFIVVVHGFVNVFLFGIFPLHFINLYGI